MTESQEPETAEADVESGVEPDVVSDPEEGATGSSEWADEGGAVAEGPATATDD